MGRRIVLTGPAAAEIRETVAWYEGRRPALGEEFLEALDAGLTRILAEPLRWRVIHGPYRRMRMDRFPHLILYATEGDAVVVVALWHPRRDPDLLERRLGRKGGSE